MMMWMNVQCHTRVQLPFSIQQHEVIDPDHIVTYMNFTTYYYIRYKSRCRKGITFLQHWKVEIFRRQSLGMCKISMIISQKRRTNIRNLQVWYTEEKSLWSFSKKIYHWLAKNIQRGYWILFYKFIVIQNSLLIFLLNFLFKNFFT